MGLELAVILGVLANLYTLALSLGEALVARPLKFVGPGLVSEPVADKVSVTSIDQDRDLIQDLGNKSEVGLHPVTLQQEVAVDIKVAAIVAVHLGTKSLHDLGLVQPLGNILELVIAKVAALAVSANIVRVAATALVRSNHSIIAVNACGNTGPDALGVVARLDQGLAAGKSVVEALALALVKNSRVAALTASHGAVVLVLSIAVGQAIANKNAL